MSNTSSTSSQDGIVQMLMELLTLLCTMSVQCLKDGEFDYTIILGALYTRAIQMTAQSTVLPL